MICSVPLMGQTDQSAEPRPAEVVLRFDKPWEGRWSGYVTVLQDDDRYRMYYRAGYIQKGLADDTTWQSISYAESTDGINWRKPELGLFDFKGSKKNNIVWKGVGCHCGFGVFKDRNPNCKPNERYKVLSSNGYKQPVCAFGSPDGIRWHLIQKEPVINVYHGAAAAYDSISAPGGTRPPSSMSFTIGYGIAPWSRRSAMLRFARRRTSSTGRRCGGWISAIRRPNIFTRMRSPPDLRRCDRACCYLEEWQRRQRPGRQTGPPAFCYEGRRPVFDPGPQVENIPRAQSCGNCPFQHRESIGFVATCGVTVLFFHFQLPYLRKCQLQEFGNNPPGHSPSEQLPGGVSGTARPMS